MKVLVFTTQFYQLGGAEGLSVQLAQRLNCRGIRADLLSMYSEDLPGVPEAAEAISAVGATTIRYLGLKIHPKMIETLKAVSRLRRLIIDEGYDVVETANPGPMTLACLATLGLRTRVVAGIHAPFDKKRANRFQDRIWRMAVTANRRAAFYGISHDVARMWVEYSATRADRTEVVYNGISDEYFTDAETHHNVRQELGIPADHRIGLFVGRLVKSKGIDTILESMAPLLRDGKLTLLYVGREHPPEGMYPDEHGLLDRMRSRVQTEGWNDRVKFLGLRRDVGRLMRAADFLIHPARLEGFGLVLAEALACRLPIVASNVQGIPEVVSNTESILLSPDHPDAYRDAVQKILARPEEERVAAADRGRARAEQFRMERRVDELISLFQRQADGQRRAA